MQESLGAFTPRVGWVAAFSTSHGCSVPSSSAVSLLAWLPSGHQSSSATFLLIHDTTQCQQHVTCNIAVTGGIKVLSVSHFLRHENGTSLGSDPPLQVWEYQPERQAGRDIDIAARVVVVLQ